MTIRDRDTAWGGGFFGDPAKFIECAQDRRALLEAADALVAELPGLAVAGDGRLRLVGGTITIEGGDRFAREARALR
jgi:hypothetical protein